MSGAKWLQAGNVSLVMNGDDGSARPKTDEADVVHIGGKVTMIRLPDGTTEGRTVVIIKCEADDGSTLMIETTLRLLNGAVIAFKARDEIEKRPT